MTPRPSAAPSSPPPGAAGPSAAPSSPPSARRGADLGGVVAALAVAALGVVLLLDALGEWPLDLGGTVPFVLGAIGAVLLASGLTRRV